MARKFKIGDKVKVTVSSPAKDDEFEPGFRKGSAGRVNDYVAGSTYPYYVMNRSGDTGVFRPSELTFIERKK